MNGNNIEVRVPNTTAPTKQVGKRVSVILLFYLRSMDTT